MNGFAVFAQKEAREILRTWRIWVLPGILMFFALSGPVLARFTPEIIGSVAGSQLGGLVLPEPTYVDSYAQWVKNLSQIALFALIIIYGGIVSAECKSGTAALVLTKPVSRAAFVTAKMLVHSGFMIVTTVFGTLVTWAITYAVFAEAPARPLWTSVGVWLSFAVLFVAIMTLLSVIFSSQAGAAGVGLGLYALMSIGALWEPLAEHSPAGLNGIAVDMLAGKDPAVFWPVVSAIVLAALVTAIAALAFGRQEL